MDSSLPDDEGFCEDQSDWTSDPVWHSEAFFEQQIKDGEKMLGLVPHTRTSFLSDEVCSAIAETLNIDDCKLDLIRRALHNLILRRKIACVTLARTTEAFSTLHRISRKLTDVAEELRQANYDVGRLLDLAYTSSG